MTWLADRLSRIAFGFIRFFPGLVVISLLMIPAVKGLWLGYVPILVGAAVAWGLAVCWPGILPVVSSIPGGRWAWWLYGFPVLGQAMLIFVFAPVPSFDGFFVYSHAVTLVETGMMDPMTYYPPAQTWWYALWFQVFGGSVLVAQLAQIPLSAGVTWCTVRLARAVVGEPHARLAGLAVAWYPTFLIYVLTTPYYHYLYTLLTVLMVWLLIRYERDDQWRWIILAGAAAGLGALTKAVQLIAPLQVLVWWVVLVLASGGRSIRWRHYGRGAAGFVVGMLVVIGPWAYRNYQVFDALVPVCTSGGLVLYSANNPASNGLYSSIPDEVSLDSPAAMLAHSRWCSEQARAFMVEEPAHFARLALNKFLHTWGVEATFAELINRRGVHDPWIKPGFSFLSMGGWSVLVFWWVGGAFRAWRHGLKPGAYEALAGVLIWSNAVVYLVFEGGDRHHLPLVPLLVVMLLDLQRRADGCRPCEAGQTSGRAGAAPAGQS